MRSIIQNLLLHYYKSPQYLILFTSNRCWSHCAHCWYNESWKKEKKIVEDLSFDEICKIAKSIEKLAFLSLTGGEAFLRDDIVEIAHLFVLNVKLGRYQIPTAGFDTDMIVEKTEKLLKINPYTPFRVDVSLDGTEGTHDEIRKLKGCFTHAIDTIHALNKMKMKYPHFDVGVITTVTSTNQNEIFEISKIVEQYHPDGEWMVNVVRGKPREPDAVNIDIENYKLAHQLIEKRIGNNTYKGHSGHFSARWLSAKNIVRRKMIYEILKKKKQKIFCSAGNLGGVIYNDGSVYPCEMIDESFGNLRDFDYNLTLLWNSENAKKFRIALKRGECMCTQECFLSLNLILQPRYWPGIIAERIRLQLHSMEKN